MNGVQSIFEFGYKGIRVRVKSTELGIEKIRSDGEAKDTEFVKKRHLLIIQLHLAEIYQKNVQKENNEKDYRDT